MILFYIMHIKVAGDLVSKYSFTISAALCFDIAILKNNPHLIVDGIDDIMMSTSSPTFHALETYGISLSNETWHLIIA